MNERTRFSGRWDAGGGGRRLIGRLGMIGVMALGMAGASLFGGGAQTAFASGIILGGGGGGGGGSATSTTTTLAVTSPTQPSGLPAGSAVASVGQQVTFTATVSPAPDGGTVVFLQDRSPITCESGSQPLNSSGQATCAITYTSAGSYTISAIYNGDTNYGPSSTFGIYDVALTVNKASTTTSTTTTLKASANPVAVGQQVTFTAAVSPAPDGGTVTIYQDGSAIVVCGMSPGNIFGECIVGTIENTAGSHTISATYNGDTNYLTSGSGDVTLTVNKASTTTSLSASANPVAVGQRVTFTATVSPAPDGGTVTFTDGTSTLCSPVTVSNGKATCAVTESSAGSHAISAIYNSDTNYSGSTSNTVTLTVNKASTATTLAVTSPTQPSGLPAGSAVAVVGQQVTFTAMVKPAPDGGTVTFTDGATILCSQVAVSNGKATCSVTESSAGSHSITGSYSGDNNYTPSVSFDLTLYVDTNISKYLQNGVYDLRDINLSNGYFVGENLSGANLSNGKFSGANFSYANLSGASLSNGNFSYANFTGANLSAANLTQTNLKGATGLGSATLADVTWNMTTCPDNTDSNTDGGTCVGHL